MVKPKILYVDDENINLLLFDINLNDKYNVLTAINGANGLEVLAENNDIDIVVSDMRMPGMNGLEFVSKVKSKYAHVKCFMLTGYGITAEIQAALDKGIIKACLSKPFNLNKICSEFDKELG